MTALDPASRADWSPPVRPEFAGLQPYGAPRLEVPVTLNVNENPFPPPPDVVSDIAASVAEAAAGLNRYPDREAEELRASLAGYLNAESLAEGAAAGAFLTPGWIWPANGSNEVMLQLLQAFGGPQRTILTFPPTYSMYPEYARDTHTATVEVPTRSDFTIDIHAALAAIEQYRPDLIVVASPNNPTGTAVDPDVLAALLAAAPGLVVVDEAYAEFARPGSVRAVTWLPQHPQLVVVRTMSKAFALAGARVGYAAADPRVIDAIRVVRLPYHLSAVTQATATAALRHRQALLAQVGMLRDERDALVGWLRERGYRVADSDANFVFFGLFADRHAVWRRLVDQGVLIRETGPEGWLRVSIGTPQENELFRRALIAADTDDREGSP